MPLLVPGDLPLRKRGDDLPQAVGGLFGLNCSGDGEGCTDEQNDILGEYENSGLYAPTRRAPTDWSCEMFDDTDFKRGTGTHGHSVGYLTSSYRANKPQVLSCCYTGLQVTSDWRCPQGNAAVGGTTGSWHMEGNGGDFAFPGRDLTKAEHKELADYAAQELGAGGISAWGDPCENCFQYKAHIHIDWR